MDFKEYQRQAMVTKKPHETQKDQIVDGLLGLAGESGEVLEYMKKHFAKGIPFQQDILIKEMGDVLWYMTEICDAYDIELDAVATRNIEKLRARHGDKYRLVDNRTGDGA